MLFDKIMLEPDEKVIKTARAHWFIIGMELVGIVLFALLPIFSLLILNSIPQAHEFFGDVFANTQLLIFGCLVWVFFCTIAAAMMWTHYYLDLWIITDRRIIVIDQVAFFNRKVSSFRLERLQDIKVRISGFLPTILNFGTLRAQTASSAESNFISPNLPAPRELQSLIQTAMDARLKALHNPRSDLYE